MKNTSMKDLLRHYKNNLVKKIHIFRNNNFDNFVFVHINKTGGTSVGKALNLPLSHSTAREKIEIMGRQKWESRFSFAIVRNPWDKVVSHYHYRVKTKQTNFGENAIEFKEWVKLSYGNKDPFYYDKPRMFMPQVNWISDREGKVAVNFIGRFESLNDDFQEICKNIGKKATLPHLKSSKHAHYKDYYDEETMKIIERCFQKDIELFEYKF
ncbi:MAG: sulfotransferase family 2 domain-containing protein [Cyanobacteria bacterium SBLK]|nr:sulfotransferase family 2 domain-containing protein [Cyanobacteria bacterium SBLK]